MTIIDFGQHSPRVHPDAFIAPSASVIGQASVHAGAVVMFGAVIRGDREEIVLGEGSNLQDCVVVHADPGFPARIGAGVSVGHGAVIHGATLADSVLVGMNATVLNGAVIGEGSIVAAGAVILEGTVIPPHSLVAGVPGSVRRDTTPEEREHIRANATTYLALAATYRGASPA
jgi:carbonic anhydrase/acetyltransferase-like protein (isoleucine patch superfamily)